MPQICYRKLKHYKYQTMCERRLNHQKDRQDVNILLRKMCILDGMNPIWAWIVYHTVRAFGIFAAQPRKHQVKKLYAL